MKSATNEYGRRRPAAYANANRFANVCVADVDKISEACLVTNSQAIIEISRLGDQPYIVIQQGQATIGTADALHRKFIPKN
jgi:hypothetical protein